MAVKATLMCFELAYGLKGNYFKSKVGGEVINSDKLLRYASALNCVIMKAHFTYLGMKVGGNHKRLGFSDVVLEKIEKRLRKRKGKFLSMAGRVCLIKFVLNSIPLFHISCFYMSMSILKELEK